ncbi:ATP-binding protein [Pseudomonas aeruginosa]|uniref:ATP-binding protein n=1 Tax=Pseudomonas aeruginosa TaxID=287 RepID=UPI001D09BB10|nr:ATP-binding protein [Pseudomonas aeruginosa]MCC0192559.1 response regulator [Pseudomonas aeruginosa]MCC0226561.1 response regulator [Pseudomonas aeruginosa]MCC0451791.1 response regulator [Pseudomonas aeruginosa]MDI3755900.1 ATP-binding protein [Pseudomonas aeruginosa]MDI3999444.1 ATP-binding protein [Pseudomonas aeruginosa]
MLWLLMGAAPLAQSGSIDLSPEERSWIARQSVLRVGIDEGLVPFEFLERGKLKGPASQYLKFIRRATGLQFQYVPSKSMSVREQMLLDGQVDLLSSHLQFESQPGNPAIKKLVYHTSPPIIVTRIDYPDIFDLDQLQDKNVMVPDVEHYERIFADRSIDTRLIKSMSAQEMLSRVAVGSADAVVATETFLMPYLYRQFQGKLEVSGVVGSQLLLVSMAVRADNTQLVSILEKVMASVSLEQRKAMYEQWYQELNLEEPTLQTISSHYLHVIVLATLAFVGLAAFVLRGIHHWRRAAADERARTRLLNFINRELRSPMNAVFAAIELLLNTRLDPRQRHFCNLANSSTAGLRRVLDDGLNVSEVSERGLTGQLTLEPTEVGGVLEGVVGLHRLRAQQKKLELELDVPAHLPPLILDSSRLAQVIHNLLSNAIKFTETGGVQVRVSLVRSLDSVQSLQVIVRDTGNGVPESEAASLFQPYAQVRHDRKVDGTGLGLVICRQLVSAMQGTMVFDSKQGVGTTVTLCLPVDVAAEKEETPKPQGMSAPRPHCGLRILVVEDLRANQEVLIAQINGLGCYPVIAADAAQAKALFKEHDFDMVLMDCELPDQDGYSLTHELRAVELSLGRVRRPIIAISASTGGRHATRCKEAGMDEVLSKPISLGELRAVLGRWCDVSLAVPSPIATAPASMSVEVSEEMTVDLGRLIQAVALCDRPSALRFAHRLRGAALIMKCSALGRAAEQMEELLREGLGWDDPSYARSLQSVVLQWQILDDGMSLDALHLSATTWKGES